MVDVLEHPILFVYVMVVVPAETPVTSPELDIVATVVLLEFHGVGVAAIPLPVN